MSPRNPARDTRLPCIPLGGLTGSACCTVTNFVIVSSFGRTDFTLGGVDGCLPETSSSYVATTSGCDERPGQDYAEVCPRTSFKHYQQRWSESIRRELLFAGYRPCRSNDLRKAMLRAVRLTGRPTVRNAASRQMPACKCAEIQKDVAADDHTGRKPEAPSATHKNGSASAIIDRDLVGSRMSEAAGHGTPAKSARHPMGDAGDSVGGQLRGIVTHRAQNW
jgi:hypothetical protein